MIQYIYEDDYGPLPGYTKNVTPPSDASPKNFFPHTCDYIPAAKCYCDENRLCPHHDCANGCREGAFTCKDFICKRCHPTKEKPDSLLIHAKMYEVGDKYAVSGLKELARKKFEIACHFHWNEPWFFDAAYLAFNTTQGDDKGLRDIVCGTICDHLSLTEEPEFDYLREDIGELGYALFQHLVRKEKEKGKAHKPKRRRNTVRFRNSHI